jgi:flagellar basal-body rod protein FlgC
MSDPLLHPLKLAGAGLAAQSTRLRVLAENLANANTTSTVAGGDPYRRKIVSFREELATADQAMATLDVARDTRPFRMEHQPGHPAADAAGFVKRPNVDVTIELADMREANRTYLANLQVIRQTREAVNATLDLLRGP